jgi:cation transport ATPase
MPFCSLLTTSISTLLRCAFGDFDYDSVVKANRTLGPVYFFMWLLYAAVILLNMAIAIISESFVKVSVLPLILR